MGRTFSITASIDVACPTESPFFYHPNGKLKSKDTIFHGTGHGWSRRWAEQGNLIFLFPRAINGEEHRWDSEGRLVFWGEYVYGVLIRYKQWNASGDLIGERIEPDPDMLGLIESQRAYYENRE